MLTPNHVRAAIYFHFTDKFDGFPRNPNDSSRVTFDNVKFEPPEDQAWIRLAVRHQVRNQVTLGGSARNPEDNIRKFNSVGLLLIQIFVPVETNTEEADRLALEAADLFDAKSVPAHDRYDVDERLRILLGNIQFEAASSNEGGVDGKWWGVLVEAPFSYETVK